MSITSEQAVVVPFITSHPQTGAGTQADETPTGVLVIDGTDDDAVVTISGGTGGSYVASFTLPVLTTGQGAALRVSAAVATVARTGIVWSDSVAAAAGVDAAGIADAVRTELATELAHMDADVSDAVSAAGTAVATLHDFDPAVDVVARVTLVDTTTGLTNAPTVTVDLTDVLTAIAALPDDTDVAALDAILDAIKAKTDTLGAAAVTVTSPVAASGTITLYGGDDYLATDARSIIVTIADSGHALSLDTAAVSLKCMEATWIATSVTETTPGYSVTFEPSAAETALLSLPGQAYEIEAVLDSGSVVTLARGRLLLVDDIPAVLVEEPVP